VIDFHDREIVGWESALRGRAKAFEEACIARFGTLRPHGSTPVIRSDNGLIFQSRRFLRACRDYRLRQEFTTPYTPEQNGLIERSFRSLKEECTWQTNFRSFREAKRAVGRWIEWYNEERPHDAFGHVPPLTYLPRKTITGESSFKLSTWRSLRHLLDKRRTLWAHSRSRSSVNAKPGVVLVGTPLQKPVELWT